MNIQNGTGSSVLLLPSASVDTTSTDADNGASTSNSLSDDCFYHILLLAGPRASATLGLTCSHACGKVLTCQVASSRVWKVFAVQRWGAACASLASGDDAMTSSDSIAIGSGVGHKCSQPEPSSPALPLSPSVWYGYYRQRSSCFPDRPAQISHLDLIQEQYATDPYRLLTVCILCSRTSGGYLVRTTAGQFLDRYPTPTAVLEEEDMAAMAELLHPLGLNRERTMKRFVHDFLAPWTDVKELHGCGAFAKASFDVFCRGDYRSVLRDKKADRNVKAYAAFVRRLLADGGDEDAEMEETKSKEEETKKKAKKRKPPKVRKPLPDHSAKKKRPRREGTRRSPRQK